MTIKTKPALLIQSDQTVSGAFAQLCQHELTTLLSVASHARCGADPEIVHQARVAGRRLRSLFHLFRTAVPPVATQPWNDALRTLAAALGPARDLDVFLAETLTAAQPVLPLPGGEALHQLALAQRERLYWEQVEPAVTSADYHTFGRELSQWLTERRWEYAPLSAAQQQRLIEPITPYAQQRLDKQQRRVLRTGSQIARDDAAALHQLRIECKKLRYAAEFFQPLFTDMTAFISALKALQDLLGRVNDVAMTHQLLTRLLTDSADMSIALYAGAVFGWRWTTTDELLHTRFDQRWNTLVAAGQPWWNNISATE